MRGSRRPGGPPEGVVSVATTVRVRPGGLGRWTAAAVACLALGLLPGTAHAVPAAPVPADPCPAGWLCGWTGAAYTGVASFVAQDMRAYPETTAYVGFNGGVSVWNGSAGRSRDGGRYGRCVTVYNRTDYRGQSRTVLPGQGIAELPASFGNVRSNRFHTCRLP